MAAVNRSVNESRRYSLCYLHAIGLSAVLCSAVGLAYAQQPAGNDVVAITNVTLIDVKTGEALPDRTVVIRGSKIDRIGPSTETPAPQAARTIDASGQYLIPGLIDSHVHYIDPETFGRLMIANGVTFVRDMGAATEQILSVRNRLRKGELLGPDMICTGAIVDGKPAVWPFSETCDTVEEGRAAVNKLADAGVDQIKVYSVLKPDVFRAVVAEAHRRKLRAVGHVPESVPLKDALAAGQDSCEHLTGFGKAIRTMVEGDSPATTQAMHSHVEGFKSWPLIDKLSDEKLAEFCRSVKAAGMVQCPTLVVFQGMARLNDPAIKDDPYHAYLPAWLTTFWSAGRYGEFGKYAMSSMPHMKKLVGALHKAGVTIIVGTDLANPYVFAGRAVHEEMRNLTDAGLTPAEALRAATLAPAEFFGRSDQIGRIAVGSTASMVLLRDNPLKDIANAGKIAGVFQNGRYFSRADLDELLDEARELAAGTAEAASAPANELALEAPGEVILRGRYRSTFNGMDAGDERFLITRTDDGYIITGHVRPKGWGQPFISTLRLDGKHGFVSAEWKQLTEPPTVATYAVQAGGVVATARKGEKDLKPQTLPLPADAVISGPLTAAEFMSNHAISLKVGESRTYTNLVFGYPEWRWETSKVKVTRKEDTALAHGGQSITVACYASTFDIPNMGTARLEAWVNERGITMKTILTMPFGKIENHLE